MRSKLKPSEKVKQVFHQHWIALIFSIFLTLFGTLLFVILLIINFNEFRNGFYFLISLILIPGFYFLIKWIQKRFKRWIVTNQRVITEWGVFSINIKESPLDKINSISYHKSFWGRIFNYGDVVIQTAAERGDIVFDKVAYPDKFANTVSEMRGEEIEDS